MPKQFTDAEIVAVLRGEASAADEERLLFKSKSDGQTADRAEQWRAILNRLKGEQAQVSAIDERVTTRVMAHLEQEETGRVVQASRGRTHFLPFGLIHSPLRLAGAGAFLCLLMVATTSYFVGSERLDQVPHEALVTTEYQEAPGAQWEATMAAGDAHGNLRLSDAILISMEGKTLRIQPRNPGQRIVLREPMRIINEGGTVNIGRS